MLSRDQAINGNNEEDLDGDNDGMGECDEHGATWEAEGKSKWFCWGTWQAGQVDEWVSGEDMKNLREMSILIHVYPKLGATTTATQKGYWWRTSQW